MTRLAGTPVRHAAWVALAATGTLLAVSLSLRVGPLVAVGLAAGAAVVVLALGRPVWAIALFFAALPLGLAEQLSVGPLDAVQVVAALVVGVVVLQRVVSGRAPLGWHAALGWAAALAAWALVAAATARDVAAAVPAAAGLATAVALSAAVLAAARRAADLRRLVLLLVAVGAAVCLVSLGGAGRIQAQAGNPGAVANRAEGIFQSPNQLGAFAGLVLLVALGLALGARSRAQRWVGGAGAVAAAAAALVSLSRGAWIGIGLAAVVLVVLSPRARRVLPLVALGAAVVVPVYLGAVAPQLAGVVRDRAAALAEPEANPDDARRLIYQEGWRQVVDSPLTGQGPAGFPLARLTAGSASPAVDAQHAHDVLLHVAAEAGLPAAVLLVGLTLDVARRVLAARGRAAGPERDLLAGLAAALVVLVGQGLVDFVLGNPTLQFLAFAVLGLLLALERQVRAPVPGPVPGPRDPAARSAAARVPAAAPAQSSP